MDAQSALVMESTQAVLCILAKRPSLLLRAPTEGGKNRLVIRQIRSKSCACTPRGEATVLDQSTARALLLAIGSEPLELHCPCR